MLQSMDGLESAQKNKEAGVLVVGATNRACLLDVFETHLLMHFI
jgi:hypothetical protein